VSRQLVLVHGRAQQFKDAATLKAEWVAAWREGLARSGLRVPIADEDIRFPYYGQTLHDLVRGLSGEDVARVVVRGDGLDDEERRFLGAVLEEARRAAGISEEQVEEVAASRAAPGELRAVERGPHDWRWVQWVVEALDTHLPGASGTTIALLTRDVYQYLRNPGVGAEIDGGVRSAFTPGVETVVVGHSLGSVVAYALLRREGHALGLRVPLFVTVGSPLAVTAIRRWLTPIAHPACATGWFNAMDERDVVSLYPLDEERFPVRPPVENTTDVRNTTANRHGISGYLGDPVVARRIHDALVA